MKIQLTIGKKFTLNTGNYSSVSPSIILNVDGVSSEKIVEAHKRLEIIADALLHEQIESDAKTMAIIKKLGFAEYFKNINKDEMYTELEDAVEKLSLLND